MGSIKMIKAAQFMPDTKQVQINEVPLPSINANEILVKIASASLCHSDLMLLDGIFPGSSDPVTMGHEGAGWVEDFGSNVKGFSKGDSIGFLPIKGCCFECRGCQVMNLNCENGTPVLAGFKTDGFFAEYASVDYRDCIKLPSNIDAQKASPFFCAGLTSFNSVNACECKPGDWIAIIGCGGLGQMGIQYSKAMGFKVIGIDIHDNVLATAKDLGADLTYNSMTNKSWLEELRAATKGGADATVVYSASKAAYDTSPKTLRINGVLMVIGLCPKPLEVSCFDLMQGLYRIKAETTGPPWKMPKAIEFTAKHDIHPPMSFHKLVEINDMIAKMRAGDTSAGRMVVSFDRD